MEYLKNQKIVDILSVAVGFQCELSYGLESFRITPKDIVYSKKQLDFYSWYTEKYPEKMWANTVEDACHNFMVAFVEWRARNTMPAKAEEESVLRNFTLEDFNMANGSFWKDVDNKADNPCYEATYRRGYCHGYGAAIDDAAAILKKGYSRKSIFFSIMANFQYNELMVKWRYEKNLSERVAPPDLGKIKTVTEFKEEILKERGSKCASCKKKVQRLHLDHIVPLADGGMHAKENMQLLCVTCHREKTGDENSYKAEM